MNIVTKKRTGRIKKKIKIAFPETFKDIEKRTREKKKRENFENKCKKATEETEKTIEFGKNTLDK